MSAPAEEITAAFMAWEQARRAAFAAQDRLAAAITTAPRMPARELATLSQDARALQSRADRLLEEALALLERMPPSS